MATKPMPNEELVQVFGSNEESEAMVVSGLLETAGIDCLVTAIAAPQDVLPGVGGTVVKVPAEVARGGAPHHRGVPGQRRGRG